MGSLTKYWIYNETISNITFDWRTRRDETTTTTTTMDDGIQMGGFISLYRVDAGFVRKVEFMRDEGRKMTIKRSWNQNKSHLPTQPICTGATHVRQQTTPTLDMGVETGKARGQNLPPLVLTCFSHPSKKKYFNSVLSEFVNQFHQEFLQVKFTYNMMMVISNLMMVLD